MKRSRFNGHEGSGIGGNYDLCVDLLDANDGLGADSESDGSEPSDV